LFALKIPPGVAAVYLEISNMKQSAKGTYLGVMMMKARADLGGSCAKASVHYKYRARQTIGHKLYTDVRAYATRSYSTLLATVVQ